MEAAQGDPTVVRYLYRCGLEANPRSRFTYLSWALFEKKQGSIENAKALLKQGHQLNPRDPAIVQVISCTHADLSGCTLCQASLVRLWYAAICCGVSWLYRHEQTAASLQAVPGFISMQYDWQILGSAFLTVNTVESLITLGHMWYRHGVCWKPKVVI